MYRSRTVSHADVVADRLGDAALPDLDRALAMMGIAHWAHHASRWPAGAGAKIDRSRVRRCIPLLGEFRRILRDRILAAKAKWTVDPVPRAGHTAVVAEGGAGDQGRQRHVFEAIT